MEISLSSEQFVVDSLGRVSNCYCFPGRTIQSKSILVSCFPLAGVLFDCVFHSRQHRVAVEINGPAAVAGRVTIDANGRPFRPLTIDANAADVVINNLVLTGGDVRAETGADRFGGGLANSGTRTVLDNVIVEDNFAARGGGLYNDGDMTIRNSRISENVAESDLLSSLGVAFLTTEVGLWHL